MTTRPRALLFDVFGTCVDWRTSVSREFVALGERLGISGIDWTAVADAWRGQYQPQMERVRSGKRPWVTLDVLHRESLDGVLNDFDLASIPSAERDALTFAWHRLQTWPDVVRGLHRLKTRAIIAPCSNGHIALQVNLGKHAGLPWDEILGAEIARAYKPQPEVYLRSVTTLGLDPKEVMMVAAHNDDLIAAAACGLRTAFVPRPLEHGESQTTDLTPAAAFDYTARDFIDLASQLEC